MERRTLKARLVAVGLTQLDLARRLKVPPTTLSSWLRGAHPAPGDLDQRIAQVLTDLESTRPIDWG